MSTGHSTTDIKGNLYSSQFTPRRYGARFPNEAQYDANAAFSMIAYKNQDPNQRSDLDNAKLNFENNYQKFLILFGQYSNTPLKHYPDQSAMTYPLTNKTPVFDQYPLLRPFR